MAPGARLAGRGEACLSCEGGCGAGTKDASLAAGKVQAVPLGENVELRWSCPGCGILVVEETRALDSLRLALVVEMDPLCHRCRRTAAKQHPTPTANPSLFLDVEP